MEQATLNTLVERVRNLERENARMKRLAMAAVLVVAAFLILGQAETQVAEKIEARTFVLRDESGQVRATLLTSGGGAGFALADKSGAPRFVANVTGEGVTSLGILDQAKRPRIVLHGSGETFTIQISDRNTKRMRLIVASDGTSMLSVADRAGVDRAALGVDAAGVARLVFSDRSGKPIRKFGG